MPKPGSTRMSLAPDDPPPQKGTSFTKKLAPLTAGKAAKPGKATKPSQPAKRGKASKTKSGGSNPPPQKGTSFTGKSKSR